MRLSAIIFPVAIFLASGSAVAKPFLPSGPRQTCTDPVVRKEWRTLSVTEQENYVSAVQCLAQKPSIFTVDPSTTNSTSLYDNFPEVHVVLNNQIHHVAAFLPWHRYFVHLYEKALQACGYIDNAVYWDWTIDQPDFTQSPLWSSSAFGGNGDSDTFCVVDGPFANMQMRIPEEHCLKRDFVTPTVLPNNATVAQLFVDADSPYSTLEFDLENGAHASVHLMVGGAHGGDMQPQWSPNDPVFFLHHGNIDRLWWQFQQSSPERQLEFNGNRYPFDYSNPSNPNNSIQATVDDILPMFGGFAEEVTISDVMQTEGGLDGALCYTY
ncbi:hypothetical protein GYMLUDRAFT_357660 [Collybiopsis luxurians FD-317 M1]|nr:hypothetical protein GYMLUDRAFT_357660 [Collybiopsis luxurians FD-317 M1]